MIYYKNIPYYLEVSLINKTGNFVTGKIITYNIYKSFNNVQIKSSTLTEIGNTGIYRDVVSYPEAIQYRIEYITPNKYDNIIETVIIDDKINRILGLSQENFKITNQIYDSSHNLTSAITKIYPSALDMENNTNVIAEYKMTAVFDRNRKLLEYKSERVA